MLPFLTRSSVCARACIEVLRVTVLQYKGLVDAEETLFYMIDVLGARNNDFSATEEQKHHLRI